MDLWSNGNNIYGDKALTDYTVEDLLLHPTGICLMPSRKRNPTHSPPPQTSDVQEHARKFIETVESLISQMLSKSIHAVTAVGFELKNDLIVLAYAVGRILWRVPLELAGDEHRKS